MEDTLLREAFTAFLSKGGHRITKGRLLVCQAAMRESGHFDADSLYLKLRQPGEKVSRATVYRTLDLLVEAGFLTRMLTESQAFYEVATGKEHHDHLVCTDCGLVIEAFSAGLEIAQEELCKNHGFKASSHTLKIEGICSSCQQK